MPPDNTIPNGHLVLQAIVDQAAAAGQTAVDLPAGIFMMHAPLYLRSGLHVRGQKTILRKAPSIRSDIIDHLGYGLYEVRVKEPSLFHVGMAIHLLDNRAVGFYTTVGRIVDRVGDALIIDTPLKHDYTPGEKAFAITAHAMLEATGIQHAKATGIVLDGNMANDPFRINGCRAGGVFLLGCDDVTLEKLEVLNYNGDGVSFQQCTDTRVVGCHIHHNAGGGLHPGSGSVRYWCTDNHIHHNGADGFFYCLRTTHSNVTGNVITDNGHVGVSIGERDTDHVIENNTIANNKLGAVVFRTDTHAGGDRVVLRHNKINHAGPQPAIVIPGHIRHTWIEANTITSTDKSLSVKVGAPGPIAFIENAVNGKPQSSTDIEGPVITSRDEAAKHNWPQVGTQAATAVHIKHLGRRIAGF